LIIVFTPALPHRLRQCLSGIYALQHELARLFCSAAKIWIRGLAGRRFTE
jgi:hypothetical protein